ncbi:MAG: hypothetical protein ACLFSQ_06540 [Candidatus Zixiibacteriota bacterium]
MIGYVLSLFLLFNGIKIKDDFSSVWGAFLILLLVFLPLVFKSAIESTFNKQTIESTVFPPPENRRLDDSFLAFVILRQIHEKAKNYYQTDNVLLTPHQILKTENINLDMDSVMYKYKFRQFLQNDSLHTLILFGPEKCDTLKLVNTLSK